MVRSTNDRNGGDEAAYHTKQRTPCGSQEAATPSEFG